MGPDDEPVAEDVDEPPHFTLEVHDSVLGAGSEFDADG